MVKVPDLWEDIIDCLKKTGAHKNIRRIIVIDTQQVLDTICYPQYFDRQLKALGQPRDFDNLESIEIIRAHHEPEPAERVLSWLEEFQSLDTWIGCVPSLKRVHIYGVDLR
ncbi:hypothetical protein FS749_011168 [Ceratobasidium sp. UAMH 11750]|nr:hypothetical protein FS749_011168 [Ceratobasidium sp. UAMH 11750]